MTNPTDPRPTFRDSEWILREYNSEKWRDTLDTINTLIAEGETDANRVISRIGTDEMRDISTWRDGLNLQDAVADGKRLQLPWSVSWWGSFGLVRDQLFEACGNDTNTIIELGSGWGRNLFMLWLWGGPRTARYYALEFTPSGRSCSDRLGELLPDMDLRSIEFDYNKPDFSALKIQPGKVVVFSCHSIEQIPNLDDKFIRQLIDLAPQLEGFHFEPVGWQIRAETGAPGEGSTRDYAEHHDYNQNLWQMLTRLQDDGVIRIDAVYPEAYGHTAPNSYSIIKWRPA